MGEKGRGSVHESTKIRRAKLISNQCKTAAKQEHLVIQAETVSSRMQI